LTFLRVDFFLKFFVSLRNFLEIINEVLIIVVIMVGASLKEGSKWI